MTSLRFDFTTLRLFTAVAELGSISKAAFREGIAVSALSKRVTDLEKDLGTSLLNRLPRGVEPTPAGSALLHHAAVVLRSLQQLEGELKTYARGTKGQVRMVVNESSLVERLPRDLNAFSQEYPEIQIDLREANSAAVVRAVADGLADLGVFTSGVSLLPGLQTLPYCGYRLAMIVPAGHPLTSKSQVRFADALDFDFVGLDVGSAWTTLLAEATAHLGRPFSLRFQLASFDTVCRLIVAGLGIGVAPPAVLNVFAGVGNLVAIPIEDDWAKLEMQICIRDRDALSTSAKLMVQHLARSPRQDDPGTEG